MPYKIRKVKGGYKVCKKNENKCFSKKPMKKSEAKKQMRAIQANESFDELVNGLLHKYLFEDVGGTGDDISKKAQQEAETARKDATVAQNRANILKDPKKAKALEQEIEKDKAKITGVVKPTSTSI